MFEMKGEGEERNMEKNEKKCSIRPETICLATIVIVVGAVVILCALLIPKTEIAIPGYNELYHRAIVDGVNKETNEWKAEYNPDAESPFRTPDNAKFIQDTKLQVPSGHPNRDPKRLDYLRDELSKQTLPKEFDPRTQWPKCTRFFSSIDQAGCGSCYVAKTDLSYCTIEFQAVATTSVLTDRLCIATEGERTTMISVQDLLTCAGSVELNGCKGGDSGVALKYFELNGLVSGGKFGSKKGCKAYDKPPTCGSPCAHKVYVAAKLPTCEAKCTTNTSLDYRSDKYYGNDSYSLMSNYTEDEHIRLWKLELLVSGPVAGSFMVREDLLHYKSGVYHEVLGDIVYGHVVKIVGWGETEDGIEFWNVVNSWGKKWGEDGNFRVRIKPNMFFDVTSGLINLDKLPPL